MSSPIAVEPFATRIVDHCLAAQVVVPELDPGCEPGGILAGCAGRAVFLQAAATRHARPELAQRARSWVELARTTQIHIPGLISGSIGIEVAAALCGIHDDKPAEIAAAAEAIEAISTQPMKLELFEGAAGIAWAAHGLLERIPRREADARARLVRVRDAMVDRVLGSYREPLAPTATRSFGMAHGIAGELWTLVVILGAKHPTVYARLEDLAGLRMEDPDGLVYWPPSLGAAPERGNFGSFCNGMAGHAILWCEVAKQLGDDDTLELARDAVTTTAALDSFTYSLCCGLGGQSIALAKFAELTGDEKFMRLSDERLQLAMTDSEKDASNQLPLWWGATGLTLVAWNRTHVPCFES